MKTLTIVIPVYNEAERLKKVLIALSKKPKFKDISLEQIIFVNDGSKDQTLAVINSKKALIEKKSGAKVKIISYQANQGKGYAVRKGMQASKADYTLMMDADLSTPLTELNRFLPLIKQNKAVIIGTRKTSQAAIKIPQPLYRQLLGKVFTLLSQLMLNTWVSDFTCGFKLFNKQAKQQIFDTAVINRWGYDAEIIFLARILDFKIYEIPVYWQDDKRSKVNVFRDSLQSLSELLQIRYNDLAGIYLPKLVMKKLPLLSKLAS